MFKNFLAIKVKWRYLKSSSTIVHIVVKFEGNSRRWKSCLFFSMTLQNTTLLLDDQNNIILYNAAKKQQLARLVAHLFPHDPDFHGIKRSGELHWPLDGTRYPPVIPMIFLRETRQHRQHLPLFSCEVAKRTLSTKKNIVATETITHQNQSKMTMIRLPPKKKKRIPLSLSLQAAA